MALSADISTDGNAKFKVAGIPTKYSFLVLVKFNL